MKIIFNYSEALLQVPPEVTVHASIARRGPAVRALLLPDLTHARHDASPGGLRGLRGLHRRARGGVRDPRSRRRATLAPPLRGAARRRPGGRGAGRGGGRRADRVRDRDPLRPGRRPCRRGLARQREHRARLFALAARQGALLSATGTHPWSPWQEQRIIDTDHYRRVEEGLQYVAWRNNTFSLHVHVGVRGADRAIAVCDRLRPVLPELLALSANSLFLDGRDSGLHSARIADLHQELPPLRDPGRRSAAGTRTPTTSTCWCAPTRSSSTPSCGGACARTTPSAPSRSASATPSPAPRSPRRWRG